jgi:cell division septation protein DedD
MPPGEREEPAPLRPVVEIEEREPTGSEGLLSQPGREGEETAEGPQDGAELHTGESETSEDTSEQPSTAEGEWVVAAGSFIEEDNARRQAQKLEQRGYSPFITQIENQGITYHRVNVRTFSKRDDAEELAQKVREDGFVAGLVRR